MTDRFMRAPDRFTAGTVGEVGQRMFLIQALSGPELVTVKVEKQQLAVLATYLIRAIEPLGRPGHLPEDLELRLSPDDGIDIIAGEISVAIDEEAGTVEVVIDDVDDDNPNRFTLQVSREQAAAFAIQATRLVEAGRPPCPLCGLPLDPRGHDCPRTNGHRAPIT